MWGLRNQGYRCKGEGTYSSCSVSVIRVVQVNKYYLETMCFEDFPQKLC